MTTTTTITRPAASETAALRALRAVRTDISAEISSRRARRQLLARSESRDAAIRSAALEYELDGLALAREAVDRQIALLEA